MTYYLKMSLVTTETALTTFSPEKNTTSSSMLLHQLLKNPIDLFYRLYSANLEPTETPTTPVEGNNNASEDAPPQQQSSPLQFRLHPKAEDCKSSLMAGTASVVLKRSGGDVEAPPLLKDLPVTILLHIASFMDVKSLCHLQETSKHFHSLMSDELLWRRKLIEDSSKWPVTSHLSHPRVYEETATDKTAQEIYSSCYQNRDSTPAQTFTNPVTHTLRYIMRRIQGRTPRLLMFGSGLESIPLTKRMILENNSPYKPIGLFPGKDGVGAGICVKHKETSINIVTLYTATKAERTASHTGQVKRINKLISAYNEDDKNAPELTRAVQEQCQLADGFVLIVNSSHLNEEELLLDKTMIKAMLRSGSPRNALLVLSCSLQKEEGITTATNSDGNNKPSPPSVDSSLKVADKLELCDISCPWQVRNLDVNTFEGLSDGFDWLLAATDN